MQRAHDVERAIVGRHRTPAASRSSRNRIDPSPAASGFERRASPTPLGERAPGAATNGGQTLAVALVAARRTPRRAWRRSAAAAQPAVDARPPAPRATRPAAAAARARCASARAVAIADAQAGERARPDPDGDRVEVAQADAGALHHVRRPPASARARAPGGSREPRRAAARPRRPAPSARSTQAALARRSRCRSRAAFIRSSIAPPVAARVLELHPRRHPLERGLGRRRATPRTRSARASGSRRAAPGPRPPASRAGTGRGGRPPATPP